MGIVKIAPMVVMEWGWFFKWGFPHDIVFQYIYIIHTVNINNAYNANLDPWNIMIEKEKTPYLIKKLKSEVVGC